MKELLMEGVLNEREEMVLARERVRILVNVNGRLDRLVVKYIINVREI